MAPISALARASAPRPSRTSRPAGQSRPARARRRLLGVPLAAGLALLSQVVLSPAGAQAETRPADATARGTSAGSGAELRYVTDERGRALILHALNTASGSKGATGLPWIAEADVARERQVLGTNAVRYLVQWKNIEPKPGRYDEKYLDEVAKRLAWYRKQGMHVILDMHQDIFGPAACHGAGNGAPAWATYTDGLPCTPQQPWVLTYLQPGVLRAYDNLWNNTGKHPELARHYAAMWKHVAARFAKEPAVLGYDLMNEPFGGTKQFGFFEGPVLTPFYQRIINQIRTVDRDNWIFVEPQSIGINQGTATSLGALRDPRTAKASRPARLALAPHFYPGAVDLGGSYTGITKALVKLEFVAWKANMTAAAKRLGTPLWIGEVGAMSPKVPGALDYTADWLAMTDELRIGWAYWSNDPGHTDPTGTDGANSPTDADGKLTPIGEALVRPYPRAVAGTPTGISYGSGSLSVSWRNRAGVSGPTELWLPAAVFPGTPQVTFTDPAKRHRIRWNPGTRVLSIWADPKTPTHTVTVRAATG